jgi:molybdate transport system substrate-binding protein
MLQLLNRASGAAVRHFALPITLAAVLACSAGVPSGSAKVLTVFAAASLNEAFTEVAAAFEQVNPGISVDLNFAGSQLLRVQLEHGAGADVFASADQRHMDLAIESGLISGDAIVFASNTLVIVVPKADTKYLADSTETRTDASSPRGSEAGSLIGSSADLARKDIKLALAQPEVPAGRYARAVIQRMAQDPRFGPDYARKVLANVVTEEPNVRRVLQKVALGEVDAGMVYYSDAEVATNISVIAIPNEANVVASYTFALLRDSNQMDLAEAFIKFVLSPPGQAILGEHGFSPPVPSDRQLQGQR